jgi:hypothetical protein
MFAMLHPGEMILPAGPAQVFWAAASGASGGGDAHVHFHVSAVDASGVQSLFQKMLTRSRAKSPSSPKL